MDRSSQPKSVESQNSSETGKPNHYQDDNHEYSEPYEPNNSEYNECEEPEIVQDNSDASFNFEDTTSPPQETKDHAPVYIDHVLPPAKYANMTEFTEEYWKERKQKMLDLQELDMLNKNKNMSVPMARVKKIMRIDDDVRQFMIASDAPIFMAQAAEFFIEEMTGMGWQFVSESRRRILQRNDISAAVRKNDQFDFLIDFLPPPAVPNSNQSLLPYPNSNYNVERKPPYFHTSTPPSEDRKFKVEQLMSVDNERVQMRRRTFDERKRKNSPPQQGDLKFSINQKGNEYQITVDDMSVPTTSSPSTSNYQTPTTSTPSTFTETHQCSAPSTPIDDSQTPEASQ